MDSARVDDFSLRLGAELSALSWQERNELLVRIGRMELRMRAAHQERPAWHGPVAEDRMLGADVVVPTEQGERRGKVICFGVMNAGPEYERTVIVYVPSSGTQHEVLGSATRLADPDDTARMQNELAMAARLAQAAQVTAGPTPLPASGRPRRRGQRDPQLVERMLAAASGHPKVRALEEGGSNVKVTGLIPGRRLYVFRSQLRVDLSGFSLEHPGVRGISDAEAREMHLGKVRGQVLFDDTGVALAAFSAALEQLG